MHFNYATYIAVLNRFSEYSLCMSIFLQQVSKFQMTRVVSLNNTYNIETSNFHTHIILAD